MSAPGASAFAGTAAAAGAAADTPPPPPLPADGPRPSALPFSAAIASSIALIAVAWAIIELRAASDSENVEELCAAASAAQSRPEMRSSRQVGTCGQGSRLTVRGWNGGRGRCTPRNAQRSEPD